MIERPWTSIDRSFWRLRCHHCANTAHRPVRVLFYRKVPSCLATVPLAHGFTHSQGWLYSKTDYIDSGIAHAAELAVSNCTISAGELGERFPEITDLICRVAEDEVRARKKFGRQLPIDG